MFDKKYIFIPFSDLSKSFEDCDVCAISIPQAPISLKDHGFYKLDKEGFVEDILFQADISVMEENVRDDGLINAVRTETLFLYCLSFCFISFVCICSFSQRLFDSVKSILNKSSHCSPN